MTSEGDPDNSVNTSSDDECLATLKRKSEDLSLKSDKRTRNCDNEIDVKGKASLEVEVKIGEVRSKEDVPKKPRSHRRKAKSPKKYVEVDEDVNCQPEVQIRRFECVHCDAIFKRGAELKRHAILHKLQTRHKCPRCGRCFTRAHGLRTHQRAHDAAPLRCPVPRCRAAFALKLHLNRHLRRHEPTERCETLGEHASTHREPQPERRRQRFTPNVITDSKTDVNIKADPDSEDSSDSKAPREVRKREELDYNTQCAIVNKMHKGRSVTDICAIYKINKETLYEIWEERDDFAIVKLGGKLSTKCMNKTIDEKILQWIADCKARSVQITGKMVQDTAEEFAKEAGFVAFNGCKKWLDRFKQKYSIVFRSAPYRKEYNTNPLDSKWRKQFLSEQWQDARFGVSDEDIYTADEIGFYFNPSKGRVKKMSGRKFLHGSIKDRLSIFACSNATGSDKKKLLVCGTEDPLIRSCRNTETLPVIYIRQAQAHFTTQMFEEFVKYWNRELMLRDKKAILLLDRATIHTKLQMSHLKLIFVPWKASNVLMPMKNGIFQRFRKEFRRLLLQEKAMNAIRGVDKRLTCLDALQMLEKAWNRTPAEWIFKCFQTTGYDVIGPLPDSEERQGRMAENDEESICEFLSNYDVEPYYQSSQGMDSYITVDDELLTAQGTNGSIFGGNHKSEVSSTHKKGDIDGILPIGSERPDTDEIQSMVCKKRTLEDLEIVRRYLQSKATAHETFKDFMAVEKFLLTQYKMM